MISYEMWTSILAGLMVLLVAAFLWWSFHLVRTDKVSRSPIFGQYLVALRSAFIFLAMTVPVLWWDLWVLFPENLKMIYRGLPFWFSFCVGSSLGGTLHYLYHVLRGILFGTIGLLLLNYLMPGGAGPLGQDTSFIEKAWLPGGYNRVCAYIFSVFFVFMTFTSRLSPDTKQFQLGMFSIGVVMYFNPQDAETFRAVLWDWNLRINWQGPVICQIGIVLVAALCAVLTLPVTRWHRRLRKNYLCTSQVAKGLHELARDSMACMDRLITHFREETSIYALESSYLYIRQLGARRTAISALLEDARWESCRPADTARLCKARQFCDLLRGFRQVLRIMLDHLRSNNEKLVQARCDDFFAEGVVHLDLFVVSCADALTTLSMHCHLWHGPDETTREEIARTLLVADRSLLSALQHLRDTGRDSHSFIVATAFVETLRNCTAQISAFLEASAPEDTRPSIMSRLSFYRLRHKELFNALPNTLSWNLAFLWSTYQRGYKPGCVVCFCMVFQPTLGSLFDKNINRMIGVALGFIVGNLPAELLIDNEGSDRGFGRWHAYPQGLIIYLCIMFLMWTIAMYGFLATGAKYSYGYMLWAGFGGAQMMWHLEYKTSSNIHTDSMIFMDMMDQFLACLIVLVVDLVFARLFGELTMEKVATAVPQCLEDIASIVGSFVDEGPQNVDISVLCKDIANSRFWDGEVQKEDIVWSLLWSPAYKMDFVHALLDQCDNVYVAAYAMQASSARCGKAATPILQEMLQRSLEARARLYARVTRAALREDLQIAKKELAVTSREEDLESHLLGTFQGSSLERSSLADVQQNWFFEAVQDGNGEESAMTDAGVWAAKLALRSSVCALRLALQRIEVLLREQEFWACEAWAFEALPESAGSFWRFDTSPGATPARSRAGTWEVQWEHQLSPSLSRQLTPSVARQLTPSVQYAGFQGAHHGGPNRQLSPSAQYAAFPGAHHAGPNSESISSAGTKLAKLVAHSELEVSSQGSAASLAESPTIPGESSGSSQNHMKQRLMD